EQFGVGGQTTVRGYRPNALLTDNGWLLSSEVRLPILRIPEVDGLLQVAPFLDLGGGWNNGDFVDPEPGTLASTGLGLVWRMGENFNARLDWGIPLTSGRSLRDSGLQFRVNFFPF
ncbi:MAG: BamA/TamA family outer membrane protein, partial [Cyanobacteria bacterium P01_A01_bin.114]